MALGTNGRLFVTMDVSFHEEISFYSLASKELVPDCSEKESVPHVDSISPPDPVRYELAAGGGFASKVLEESEARRKSRDHCKSTPGKGLDHCSHLYHRHLYHHHLKP